MIVQEIDGSSDIHIVDDSARGLSQLDNDLFDNTHTSQSHWQAFDHQEGQVMVLIESYSFPEDKDESDDSFTTDDDVPEKVDITDGVPKIGMEFDSEQQAYDYYNRYARSVGFSISRSSSTHRKDKTISRRVLQCSNAGMYKKHPRGSPVKPRLHARTGCQAKLIVKLKSDNIKYSIEEFVEDHNHQFTCPSQVHILRSHRRIETSQARLIENLHYAGISQKNIFRYLSAESGGSMNLNFTKMECNNYIQRRRRGDLLSKADAEHLLEYFQSKQKDNPYFFYEIQVDKTGQLCNCFWSDAKCRMDYSFFGDVLVFDTTFNTNDYDKPFAPFIGVNNHGQTIIYGCALLLDESTDSFVWLFKTFLNAMRGKHPQTIFTDQASAIIRAIKQVFPNTHHRLCLWHIFQLAAKHLSHVYSSFKNFSKDFKGCIYDNETEEEFESMWNLLLQKYKLTKNKWLLKLYKKKEMWAQVYGRSHFCAGMTTTQRSEGMNNFFKKYLKRTFSFKNFVIQLDQVLTSRRDDEKLEDFRSMQKKPEMRTGWPIEVRAAERYTPYMFSFFQKEIVHTLDLIAEISSEDGPISTYKVTSFTCWQPCTVIYNASDSSIQCSCKQFQFTGVLCAHSLKIFNLKQMFDIPLQYYSRRWTIYAKDGSGIEEPGKPIQGTNVTSSQQYSELAQMALSLAMKGTSTGTSSSYTKKLLTGAIGELDNYLKSSEHQTENAANENMGEANAYPLGANITLRDPPRKKKKTKKAGRIKAAVEKSKPKHCSKSSSTKAAMRLTQKNSTKGKRKRQSEEEAPKKKETTKKNRVQTKLAAENRKGKSNAYTKPKNSDVEEIPPFNTGDQEFTPTHGISVPSSLNGSATLSIPTAHEPNCMHQIGDYTMPSIPYYCPQLDSEDTTLVEDGEAPHHVKSNESFLALLSQQCYPRC